MNHVELAAIRRSVNAKHIAAGTPWLSTDPADHDEGCPRIHDSAGRCACSSRPPLRPCPPREIGQR